MINFNKMSIAASFKLLFVVNMCLLLIICGTAIWQSKKVGKETSRVEPELIHALDNLGDVKGEFDDDLINTYSVSDDSSSLNA